MFALYDKIGINFRGSVDDIYRLKPINPTNPIQNDVAQNKSNFINIPHLGMYQGEITKEAKEAYRKMAKLDFREKIFHVRDIMMKNILTISSTSTIEDAFNMMRDNNISQLPVISEQGKLNAIISKDKILDFLANDPYFAEKNFHKTVDNIADTNFIATDQITDIRRIAKVMVDYKVNALPVIDTDDNMIGIISRSDIIKAVASNPPLEIWG